MAILGATNTMSTATATTPNTIPTTTTTSTNGESEEERKAWRATGRRVAAAMDAADKARETLEATHGRLG